MAIIVADSPVHIVADDTDTVGIELTVIVPVPVATQPFNVYKTEYVVVKSGETVIAVDVCALFHV